MFIVFLFQGLFIFISYVEVGFFFLHASLCITYVYCLWRPEESIISSGKEITDGCEPPCGIIEMRISVLSSWVISLAMSLA